MQESRYAPGQRSALPTPAAGSALPSWRGWWAARVAHVLPAYYQDLDTEDHLLFAGIQEDGSALDAPTCNRLFDLPALHSTGFTDGRV